MVPPSLKKTFCGSMSTVAVMAALVFITEFSQLCLCSAAMPPVLPAVHPHGQLCKAARPSYEVRNGQKPLWHGLFLHGPAEGAAVLPHAQISFHPYHLQRQLHGVPRAPAPAQSRDARNIRRRASRPLKNNERARPAYRHIMRHVYPGPQAPRMPGNRRYRSRQVSIITTISALSGSSTHRLHARRTCRYSRTDATFSPGRFSGARWLPQIPFQRELLDKKPSDGGISSVRHRIQCMICHLHRIGAPHHDPHQHSSSTCSPVPRDAPARHCRHACAGGRILPPAPRFPVSLVQPADHRLGINQP